MDPGAGIRRDAPRRFRLPWRRCGRRNSARRDREAARLLCQHNVHRNHWLPCADPRAAAAPAGPVRPARGRTRLMADPSPATGLRCLFWLIPLTLLPLPLWLDPYQQYVLNTVLVYVPVGIGFNLVVGNLGLLAFSNVAYFGLGAYT